MKLVVIGDLHLQDKGKIISDLYENVYYIKQTLALVKQLTFEHQAKIVFLGDFFENKRQLPQQGLFEIIKFLYSMAEYTEIFIIAGNHDYYEIMDKPVTWLEGIKHPNIKILLPQKEEIYTRENCAFFGYSSQDILKKNLLEILKRSDVKFIFSHFGIQEANVREDMSLKNELSLSSLMQANKNKKVFILGHYHKPQHIIKSNFEVIYPGSVYPVRVDEIFDQKRFLIIDTEKENFLLAEVPAIAPLWHQILLEKEEDVDIIIPQIEQFLKKGEKVFVFSKIIPPLRLTELIQNYQTDCVLKIAVENNFLEIKGETLEKLQNFDLKQTLIDYGISELGEQKRTLIEETVDYLLMEP